jgi:hypothetical protein
MNVRIKANAKEKQECLKTLFRKDILKNFGYCTLTHAFKFKYV